MFLYKKVGFTWSQLEPLFCKFVFSVTTSGCTLLIIGSCCSCCTKLEETKGEQSGLHDSEVILINEGQFFDDLVPFVLDLVNNKGKKVFVCGLDGDYKKRRFGNIIDLIPEADTYRKLQAVCIRCKDGTPAPFTHRLSSSKNQTLIGSSEYIPLCRRCHQDAQQESP